MRHADWFEARWPAPAGVRTLITTRAGGVSAAPFDTLNLGTQVGDDPLAVAENRRRVVGALPGQPCWLRQAHGTRVVEAPAAAGALAEADACVARVAGAVCVVLVADCLPVLLCARDGTVVAAAHAGWRGLAAGVLEETVRGMDVPPSALLAWLGPAIGPDAFEVGSDVVTAFTQDDPGAEAAFRAKAAGPGGEPKWLCHLPALARRRLNAVGVREVHGGTLCTVSDPARFFSHRRDRRTGRQAAMIWIAQ
jgi:YfiH family protein